MSTETTESTEYVSLVGALQARLGEYGQKLAIDVFAAWATSAAVEAEEISQRGCFLDARCPEDHAANVRHFQHVALVLRNAYEAKPLVEGEQTPIAPNRAAEIRAEERARCVAELRTHSEQLMEAAVNQVIAGNDNVGFGALRFAASMGRASQLLESGELSTLLADQGEAETR